MLDNLPLELLRLVFKSIDSLDYSDECYKARTATLQTLCLTSRRIRIVAQPVLWEVVFVGTRRKDAEMLEEGSRVGLGRSTRVIKIDSSRLDADGPKILAAMPNLERVSVVNKPAVSFLFNEGMAQMFSHLRRLSFADCSISLDTPVRFPHLVELSLKSLKSTHSSLENLFSTISLPSLRTLAVCRCWEPGRPINQAFPPLPLDLLNELITLQLPFGACRAVPPNLAFHPCPKLVITNRRNLDLTNRTSSSFPSWPFSILVADAWSFYYGRVESGGLGPPTINTGHLQQLARAIPTLSSLQAVFLPHALHPPALSGSTAGQMRDELLAACEARGVEVGWRREPFGAADPSIVCGDFVEWARGKKAEREGSVGGK